MNRIERKKRSTQQNILAAAMQLFTRQGVDATTMEQIADHADIAKGTLYNYFPVKEAILSEFIKSRFSQRSPEWIETIHSLPDTRTRLAFVLRELMAGVMRQPELFERYHVYRVQNMLSLRKSEAEESGFRLSSDEIIRLGRQSGELRLDLPAELLLGLFEFIFIEIAMQFYKDPQSFDLETAIARSVDLFLNGAQSRGTQMTQMK